MDQPKEQQTFPTSEELGEFAKLFESLQKSQGPISTVDPSLHVAAAKELIEVFKAKEQMERQAELLTYSVRERLRALPTVSALAATLLVVATFNRELIPITNTVKILLSILLAVIPIGLWGFYMDLSKATESSLKQMKDTVQNTTGKDISSEIKKAKKFNWIGWAPFAANLLITLCVAGIILLIWKII